MGAYQDLERRFGDAVAQLGFELIDDRLHGPPALEDLLADINVDADAPIRALTSLCGSGDADAVSMTRSLLDLGIAPEDAAWAARLWAEARGSRPIGLSDEPTTDPEPLPDVATTPVGALAEPVANRAAPSGIVALLFTDIEGSTKRWVDGAADMHAALKHHDDVLRTHIEARDGVVFTTSGDAFCAAFTHVNLAVATAVAIQQELAASDFSGVGGMPVRIAIHVGAVETRDGDYFGLELSRVARILGHTHAGQITLSEAAAAQLPIDRRRHLGDVALRDLDRIEPIHQLLDPDLRDDFPALAVSTLPTQIPTPQTSFVGRGEVVASVIELVDSHRLVTLLGTGGLGKTRIAIEVAMAQANHHPVVVSELAPATDRAALEGQVLSDLSVDADARGTTLENIGDAIGDNELLMVLDNCEQIVDDVAEFVEHLLARCAKLTVLATSRENLEVQGERIVRVTGLHESNLDEAVELFRARASEAGVDATVLDQSVLQDLCVRLDGLPLAIELAAAKTAVLPLTEIQAGLGNRLDLLKQRGRRRGGRHSSLRAMLDWSWELLEDENRVSLAQLAAFAGGFAIDAAAKVLDRSEGLALAPLEELLARSLIVRESDPVQARYRMLESVREYATEKAAELGLRSNAQARHLAWFAQAVRSAHVELAGGSTAVGAMQRLDRDQHEIAAALDFASTEGDVTAGLNTAVNLWDWWRGRLQLTEAIARINSLLARANDDTDRAAIAGALVIRADFMRVLHGPSEVVADAIAQARTALALIDDGAVANRYRLRLVLAEFDDENDDIADELWSLVKAARSAGTSEDTMGLHMLTALAQRRDSEESQRLARDTLSTAERHGNVVAAAHARELIAIALTDLERTDEARTELAHAVQALTSVSQPGCWFHCAESVAWYQYKSGQLREAEKLYATAIGLRQRLHRQRAGFEVHAARQLAAQIGASVEPDEHSDIDDLLALMRAIID